MQITSINLGSRVRRDMGDLQGLADSIQRHGLLHPVVVKSDGTLIAGQRRIEAAKLIGWTEIPVTVIDVADLLSAERDENAERKDFTPTEAVAIGRLIEEKHREKIAGSLSEKNRHAAVLREAGRRGEDTSVLKQELGALVKNGKTDKVAADAVGMGTAKYSQARAVVDAAETDPSRFGDLPVVMDETGNVAGTHRELIRRKTGNGRGNPALTGMRHLQPNREVDRATVALEGICEVLKTLKVSELDADKRAAWAKSLSKSASTIKATARRIHG